MKKITIYRNNLPKHYREIPRRNIMDTEEKQKTVDTRREPMGVLPFFLLLF